MKKKLALILCSLTLLCLCLTFVGCRKKEDPKYDVAFLLICQESATNVGSPSGLVLESWIISPDQSALEINREYDGKMYMYYVYRYRLINHPELDDIWFLYPRIRDYHQSTVFVQGAYYRKVNDHGDVRSSVVRERGSYINTITVKDLPMIKSRSVTLFITVT